MKYSVLCWACVLATVALPVVGCSDENTAAGGTGGGGAACVDADSEPLTEDQRGEPRPGGSMCDVGAFEVQEGSL